MAFANAMDARDWQAMETILTRDATASLGMGDITGNREITAFIRSFLDSCGPTQHLLGNVLIHVEGDTASSEAYVSDMHLAKDTAPELSFRTLGLYRDQWIKQDGSWKLNHRVKDNRATIGSMDVFSR